MRWRIIETIDGNFHREVRVPQRTAADEFWQILPGDMTEAEANAWLDNEIAIFRGRKTRRIAREEVET